MISINNRSAQGFTDKGQMDKINLFKRDSSSYTSGADGFTLLEIMVSLTILAIAIVVVIQLFSSSLRSIAVSEGYLQAEMKAAEKLREVLEDDKKLVEGSTSDVKDENYTVNIEVKPAKEDRTQDLDFDLFEVTLNMQWKDGQKQHNITLSTYKLVNKNDL